MSEVNQKTPIGWRSARLGEVCRIVGGSTPSSGVSEFWDGEIVWITPTDLGRLNGERDVVRSARRITEAGYKSCGTELLPVGSVIMSSRAPIGHLGIARVSLCTNQGCKSFVPQNGLDSDFLFFRLHASMPEIQALGSGSTFTEVSKRRLEKFEIDLPPLEEQRRIAERLREQLSILAEARAALEAQLKAADALPVANLRAVFETPESKLWPRKTVGQMIHDGALIEHQDGNHGELHPRNRDFVTDGLKFVTAKHINDGGRVLFDSAPCISETQASGLRIGFAQANDVLLAHNATVGKVGIAPPECEPFVVGTSLTIYRTNAKILDSKFVFYALTAAEFQKQLVAAMKQTTRNQVPITKQRTLSVPWPPLEIQRAIANSLEAEFAASKALRKSIYEKLRELKKLPAALLRMAFRQ